MIYEELTKEEKAYIVVLYSNTKGIAGRMEAFAEFFYSLTGEGFDRCPNCDKLTLDQDTHEEQCEALKQSEEDQKAYESNLADQWPE